eukprot:CAMPEP_0198281436 /NCGR_PEP_ID=MMETSP1449-20131203/1376_1 /TAXON_ID=420275 /ORGANISM="Attheya septentrionalis, Strain CCMP2084" /LENGTH=391 /DNA_ID=CAMNT_0043977207 /DNA_START=262 /DNA_END=1437 /DNA_ORIENTATION=-
MSRLQLLIIVGKIFLGLVLCVPFVTILFAVIATVRHWFASLEDEETENRSAVCTGRVQHVRYRPVVHGFSYPLFFCWIDLDHIDRLFGGTISRKRLPTLWPLTYLASFREDHHLKNGEGLLSEEQLKKEPEGAPNNSLAWRVCRLMAERTNQKFQPTPKTHRIGLVTHIQYFGYCFNPVSFYYIYARDQTMENEKASFDAIVAEVSNTPWNEMHCYVLHPDSVDMTTVQAGKEKSLQEDKQNMSQSTNYMFRKVFHVSPFMEMDHMYDWTFWHDTTAKIAASTTMRHAETDETYFNATFDVNRHHATMEQQPWTLAWQLLRLPFYCVVIQIWIHYEAVRIFVKGVAFVPHPEGSETGASQVIGTIMDPIFRLKDWWNGKSAESEEEEKKNL